MGLIGFNTGLSSWAEALVKTRPPLWKEFPMREIIERAVHERRLLQVNYHPGERLIEPHAFGYSSEGNLLIRAYQVEGASASGEHEWWKLLRLDRVLDVVFHSGSFAGPRPEYKRGDRAMKGGIIAQL